MKRLDNCFSKTWETDIYNSLAIAHLFGRFNSDLIALYRIGANFRFAQLVNPKRCKVWKKYPTNIPKHAWFIENKTIISHHGDTVVVE